jgi:hypothetical protein
MPLGRRCIRIEFVSSRHLVSLCDDIPELRKVHDTTQNGSQTMSVRSDKVRLREIAKAAEQCEFAAVVQKAGKDDLQQAAEYPRRPTGRTSV